jgi:hypothetical protein
MNLLAKEGAEACDIQFHNVPIDVISLSNNQKTHTFQVLPQNVVNVDVWVISKMVFKIALNHTISIYCGNVGSKS